MINMKICVYGASSNAIDKIYIDASEKLGREIAERKHTLIYGAGAGGVMGGSARGAASAGGEIIGIAPSFFNVDGMIFEGCTELIRTETMRERKKMMEDMSDAFVMAPGGIGTFDEFFEILTLKQLSRHTKAIVVYNVGGYFDKLLEFIDQAVAGGFITQKALELFEVFDTPEQVLDYIGSYVPEDLNILNFRNLDM